MIRRSGEAGMDAVSTNRGVQSDRRPADLSPTGAAESVLDQMRRHQFVFLGGLHRSGTSLAFRCLREHPEVSGFHDTGVPEDEGQHLQSVFPKAFRHGGPARFGFAQAMHLDDASSLVTPENRRKLFEEWSRYWDVRRPYLLEKSPPNLIKSRFLQAMFPNTYFIFMLRHPVAVTLATRKWKPRMPLRKFIEHWLVCHEKMREDLQHLERAIVFGYEDFVRQSETTLSRIYEFLGLEPAPTSEDIQSDVNQKYFEQWREQGQGILGRSRLKRIVSRYESRCNAFGYSLASLSDPASDGRARSGS